ncbi:carbohydrate porin [Aristophania vespae]|uniref:Carbohydrate porin n=2 Tax=Aristophania vespae TaxID=2697033 RepID=A0A6P1NGF7_9PROT|nr:carbohydrate porin [Aristophania vespae]
MLKKLAPVHLNPTPSNTPNYGYEPIQYGVFGQNAMDLPERVHTSLNNIAFDKGSSVPALPRPEALLPDPFGWNTYLRDHGIAILLDNTNEFANAITSPTKRFTPRHGGGLKQGGSNAGQYGFENDIDWEKLAGATGLSTHVVGVGRYGIPGSNMFGDNLNPSSEIYGGGGNVFFHLVYFYAEETLFNGRLDIIAGHPSFLSDFSSDALYCNFMNNAFCGNLKPSSDNYARSSYPASSWGTRIRVRPTDHTYIQVGIYFPQKGIYYPTQNRTGFKFNGGDISGQTIPIEIGWTPEFGKDKLPGNYKLGFDEDTADHDDNYYDVNGRPWAITGAKKRVNHNAWGAWVIADQMLMRNNTPDTAEGGLFLIAGAYFNQPRASTREREYQIGLVDTGFWSARPLDAFGINYGYHRVSGSVARTQRLQEGIIGGSTINGGPGLMNGSYGIQRSGSTIEAMYRIHVMRGVTFAPDFQYYIHPGAQKALKDAAMLGFKSHIQLF